MQIHWLFFLIPDIKSPLTGWLCNRRTGTNANH